jgi:hypothetical protein
VAGVNCQDALVSGSVDFNRTSPAGRQKSFAALRLSNVESTPFQGLTPLAIYDCPGNDWESAIV